MRYSSFSASNKGARRHMEDRSFLIENFMGTGAILGGVFDGHGGAEVAEKSNEQFPARVQEHLETNIDPRHALNRAFNDLSQKDRLYCGCCALVFYIKDNIGWVANCGDCRMIIVTKKLTKQLTSDHRIADPAERKRIEKYGGYISGKYACKGERGLMPTRTLGDGYFADIGIIATPEISEFKIEDAEDIYLVAATDGLWDEVWDDDANLWTADICHEKKSPKKIANEIVRLLVGYRSEMSQDNISVIVIKFSPEVKRNGKN